jgi:hypothetical protein
MSTADTDSKWWLSHLMTTVGVLLQLGWVLVSVTFGFDNAAANVLLWVSLAVLAVFLPLGLLGYFNDAKALRRADAGWQPNPWLWFLGGWLLGQVLAMPLFLLQRWRHVGLDWSDVPIVGRRITPS